jgi:hypothetical protein
MRSSSKSRGTSRDAESGHGIRSLRDHLALEVWAGEVPMRLAPGEPVPEPGLAPETPLSASIQRRIGLC